MLKSKAALKAIFNTANLNGFGAFLMSANVGTELSTLVYPVAIALGTVNKFVTQTWEEQIAKSRLLRFATHPAVTACIFMGAAGNNVYNMAHRTVTELHQPERLAANLLLTAGWTGAFFGDNAVRRLETVNYKKGIQALGSKLKSGLSRTFNALVSNPTIFYGIASTGMVLSELTHRKDSLGNHIPTFSGPTGVLGAMTASLVGLGILYAVRNTRRAMRGEIPEKKINDGVMNAMASTSKLGYAFLAASTGAFGLAAGHVLFAISNIKSLYETRAALSKKAEPGAEGKPQGIAP